MSPVTLRGCLGWLALLLLTGCASRGPAPVTQLDATRCDAIADLSSAVILSLDAPQPETLRFDGRRPACLAVAGVSADSGPVRYAVIRLPRYSEAWVMSLDSQIDGQSLFAPEAFTLDVQGQVLRSLPFERFTQRGDALSATLFFDAQNAPERYLLLRSARQAVGRKSAQLVSGAFAIPLLNTLLPILYMQGTERERTHTLSHNGVMRLQGRKLSAVRRGLSAQHRVRTELGTLGP